MKATLIALATLITLASCKPAPDVVCWHSVDNDLVCTEFNCTESNLRTDLTEEEYYQYVKTRQAIEASGMSKKALAQLMADLMTVTQ